MKKILNPLLLALAALLILSQQYFMKPHIQIQIPLAEAEGEKETPVLRPRVIYGSDDRLDLFEIQDVALADIAQSTLAVMEASVLQEEPDGRVTVKGSPFGEYLKLCDSEPFREQETAAFCSAFLVDPQTVLTAGHCIRSTAQCSKSKFVFGFALKKAGELPKAVPKDEVYSCKKIHYSEIDGEGADFAVIQLDRPVSNHAPLRLSLSSSLTLNSPLVVIGHPSGLPVKLAGGATVRKLASGYFVANLDTYGGNSGSAVIHAKTGEVEGILVRGETDFIIKNGCRVSNSCPDDGCRGEDVTSIGAVLPHLPAKLTATQERISR